MRKLIIFILLACMLITAACGFSNNLVEPKFTPQAPVVTEIPADFPIENPAGTPDASAIVQRLGSAAKDAYAGIEIDAFVRERKAILPGYAAPITVIIKNTGNETIDYVKGSGSYTIPDALLINAVGLQAILPEDRIGKATMDFRTEELRPGDQLEYTMHVMALEPNYEFNTYTMDMYDKSGKYIAEKSWNELQTEFPSLIPAKPGAYQGQVYFLYYTKDSLGISDFTTEPTGYAVHDFTITVS